MKQMPFGNYAPFPGVQLNGRTWPDKRITAAPTWCSVDLRDGNQALIEPMGAHTKRRMFDLLVSIGFKEIEVGFPAASQTEFDFVRMLIDEDLIPPDVTIQVLTQAREDLIRRTFEAVHGAKHVIMHVYNSTSELQRRVVFGLDEAGITKIAVDAAQLIKKLASERLETEWIFQYSPESFTGTELEFAADICNAVLDVWQPTPERKVIINLPATVEMSTPNVYADMIEWMGRHISQRESVVISLHTHNDRGTGVAATELGLMAGAERVEGTLFGNGERTGNADIVTLALNLMSQGIDPSLDFSDVEEVARVARECTNIPVHERHPYAGLLVFTAFSGSHQDAVSKGLRARKTSNSPFWEVPYIPIDPRDVGRGYQPLIRINSQSGKGGLSHVMEHDYGLRLPRGLQIDFSAVMKRVTDKTGKEILPQELLELFNSEYLRTHPFELVDYSHLPAEGGREMTARVKFNGIETEIVGTGNGPVDAFVDTLRAAFDIDLSVVDLGVHSVGSGSDALAVAYVLVRFPGRPATWGIGMDEDTAAASLHAVVSAVNRAN